MIERGELQNSTQRYLVSLPFISYITTHTRTHANTQILADFVLVNRQASREVYIFVSDFVLVKKPHRDVYIFISDLVLEIKKPSEHIYIFVSQFVLVDKQAHTKDL